MAYTLDNIQINPLDFAQKLEEYLDRLDEVRVEDNEQYWFSFLDTWEQDLKSAYSQWFERQITDDFSGLMDRLRKVLNPLKKKREDMELKRGEILLIKINFMSEFSKFLSDLRAQANGISAETFPEA